MDNPTRLDLKSSGDIVLIEKSGRLLPFKVSSVERGERKVYGTWLLSGKETNLSGNLPTYPINEEWIEKYIEELVYESLLIKDRISMLKTLKFK
jgi:hypothetical protein